MDPTVKERIEDLEERGEVLQKESKYKEAMDVYQELLDINKNAYGIHSQEYEQTSIKLCELCNLISMILLQKQKFQLCLLFLKKAEDYSLKLPKQTAVTYNNYACHYRKTGKHRTALNYLQSALNLQWKSRSSETLADTYLNLCAVLSQLGRHDTALENVLFSVTLLQEQLLGASQINMERVPVLAIAYHNTAVQLQYLKRYQQSLATYEKAAKFARKHLGEEHSLVHNLEGVLKNATEGKEVADKKGQRKRTGDGTRVQKMRNTYKDQRPQTGGGKMPKKTY